MKFPNVYLKYFLYETSLDNKLKVTFHIKYLCHGDGASSFPLEEVEGQSSLEPPSFHTTTRMLFLSVFFHHHLSGAPLEALRRQRGTLQITILLSHVSILLGRESQYIISKGIGLLILGG